MTTLVWLRDDLRTVDHEALVAACSEADGTGVVAVWIREDVPDDADEDRIGARSLGAATRWWYHRSLRLLSSRLEALGIPLVFASGDPREVVPALAHALGASSVRWSRRYAPPATALDTQVKQLLADAGFDVHSHAGALLVEPWTVSTGAGKHYTVFTPFHRAAQEAPVPEPLPAPQAVPLPDSLTARLRTATDDGLLTGLDVLGLLEGHDWWTDTVEQHWTPGEAAGLARLDAIDDWLPDYRTGRDEPAAPDATSRLSPHLRSGDLSPRMLWHAAHRPDLPAEDASAWIRQLYWREFCWHLTFHVPDLDRAPLRRQFERFEYQPDADFVTAWQQGRTGLDLVDAGMLQLWHTGWMHNRVRMVTASLLVKNMLQPWQVGEQWFWDTLVDADEANNPVSWQWVAGCGADAAPYFRVFNPDRQRDRFDPHGTYLAQWLPRRGPEVVTPVVDLANSRRDALEAFKALGSAHATPS